MQRWKQLLFAGLFGFGATAQAQNQDNLQRISDEILLNGTCYNSLRVLCKTIGHRLSGTPEADRAVQWGKAELEKAGADRVWLQPVMVPKWVRGKESLKIDFGEGAVTVPMLSLGNSEGTNGKELRAKMVLVNSVEELEKLPENALAGKIVFLNYRFRQDWVNTFRGYGDAGRSRWRGPTLAAARNARAIIIRSVSTGQDDYPHTGAIRYGDTLRKIPAVAIGNATSDRLEKAFQAGKKPVAVLHSECRMMGMAPSFNVIGEIKGSEIPDEIIVAGGHLDSWDIGEGAHDDGAGCVQSIEIIRCFKALGLKPKRTIRTVLFMNEENGNRGGITYADSAAQRGEKTIFALESDGGGHVPRGFGYEFPENFSNAAAIRARLVALAENLRFLNLSEFDGNHGGTDIEPLMKTGTVLGGLSPDPQRYFDLHHTAADVFETVNHRELKLGAAAMAGLVWQISEKGL